jgi:hypothetical protein
MVVGEGGDVDRCMVMPPPPPSPSSCDDDDDDDDDADVCCHLPVSVEITVPSLDIDDPPHDDGHNSDGDLHIGMPPATTLLSLSPDDDDEADESCVVVLSPVCQCGDHGAITGHRRPAARHRRQQLQPQQRRRGGKPGDRTTATGGDCRIG